MKKVIKNIFVGLSALAFCVGIQETKAQQTFSAGHGDVGIGFEGSNFEPHWHLGEGNESVTLDGVPQTFGPDGTEREPNQIIASSDRIESRQAGSNWDFIGVNAGEGFIVFPQTQDPNVPFIGIGTEELDSADWATNITLTLTGISGSGVTNGGFFSLYTTDIFGTPTQLMSSFDGGITSGDAVSQAAGVHAHYNWAFSEAGTYNLTFEVTGTSSSTASGDVTPNTPYTASATYTFEAIPEPSTYALILLGLGGLVASRRFRRK